MMRMLIHPGYFPGSAVLVLIPINLTLDNPNPKLDPDMFLEIVLLLVGFAVLIKGADLLVDGASSAAKKMGISNLAIGLTVVAFGTSMPELVVSLLSA